jgi:hypothetical protein
MSGRPLRWEGYSRGRARLGYTGGGDTDWSPPDATKNLTGYGCTCRLDRCSVVHSCMFCHVSTSAISLWQRCASNFLMGQMNILFQSNGYSRLILPTVYLQPARFFKLETFSFFCGQKEPKLS